MSSNKKSSASYRADLDKLFTSGGKVPDRFKNVMKDLEPEEGSDEHARAIAIQTLRDAEDFRAFVKAIDAFRREGHALPDDEDLLGRMLDHPREVVLAQVLSHLLDLHKRHTLKGSASLKARLRTISSLTDDPALLDLVDRLNQSL